MIYNSYNKIQDVYETKKIRNSFSFRESPSPAVYSRALFGVNPFSNTFSRNTTLITRAAFYKVRARAAPRRKKGRTFIMPIVLYDDSKGKRAKT